MRRAVAGFWWSPTAEGTPALIVVAAFFTLGGLAGGLIALGAAEGGAEALRDYLERFLTAAQAGDLSTPALPQLIWRCFRWPVAAFLLGTSAWGLLGIPLLCGLRGFFLSFSIGAFACAYGHSGLAVAFLLQGLPGLLAVPAFFLLAVQSLSSAWSLLSSAGQGRREGIFSKESFLRCGVCVATLGASLLTEYYLVPSLISGWAGVLLN